MTVALLESLLLLAGPALLPVVAAVGLNPVVALLVLPAGGLLAAAAATLEVSFGGGLGTWYAGTAIVTNLTAAAVLASGRTRRPVARGGYPGVLVLIAASALPLVALRSSAFGWDARSIWWLHARLLTSPGAYAGALGNPAYAFSHPTYPPLLPASVAMTWLAHGGDSYRLAQSVVTVMNASAAALLGWTVAQVARGAPARRVASIVGGLLVLAVFGVAGISASNGYADMFAATTGAAAVVAGLVLPRDRVALAVAVACAWCAGDTKSEGLVNAALILLLITLRYAASRSWPARFKLALAVVPLGAWELAVAVHGGRIAEVSASGLAHQGVAYRLHVTAAAIAGQLSLLPIVAVVSLVSVLQFRALRGRLELGRQGWLWLSFAFSVATLTGIYVTGPLEIRFWVDTSVARTCMYPRLLLLSEAAVCALVVSSAARTRRGMIARAGPHRRRVAEATAR